MEVKLIALAIPVFFLMIAGETWLMRRQGANYYRFNDAVADLSCGAGSQAVGIFLTAGTLGVYGFVERRLGVFDLSPSSPWTWAFAFLAYDFVYYWWHRLSHEMNVLWAAHVVHHQSQEYNLAVALRQAWFTGITGLPFFIALALAGIPLPVYATIASLSLLYQFWIHTRTVGRLHPAFEYVFNTPSHHRVHHAINPQYIDRNHGATLILWDRLFGTFEPEGQECVYGTVEPFTSWNPVWANFHYWAKMIRESRRIPDRRDRLRLWLRDPAWRPESLGGPLTVPEVDARTFAKWDAPYPKGLVGYVGLHFAAAGTGLTALLFLQKGLGAGALLLAAAAIVATTATLGALLEGRRWGVLAEFARLGLLGALVLLAGIPAWAEVPAVAALAASALGLALLRPADRPATA